MTARVMLRVSIAAFVLSACGERVDTVPAEALGATLYQAECEACHGGATGGAIDDIPPPHNAQGHTWHHPDCQLVDIVQRGLPERPEGLPEGVAPMPAFEDRPTVEEIDAILDFIKTWWTEEQRVWQAEITQARC